MRLDIGCVSGQFSQDDAAPGPDIRIHLANRGQHVDTLGVGLRPEAACCDGAVELTVGDAHSACMGNEFVAP